MTGSAGCLHCGLPVPADAPPEGAFCCPGCEAAYDLVKGLGLEGYYRRRTLDPAVRPLKPEDGPPPIDFAYHVKTEDGLNTLNLMVEGLHCAACVWLIESVLGRETGVVSARLNMTTRRLVVVWRGAPEDADRLLSKVDALGYRLVPYDPDLLRHEGEQRQKELLRAMAVAGFAAGNIMLLSVSVWAGYSQGMGPATRDLLHWVSALIALPAIAYAGVPFFRSALGALKAGRVNMEVPISLAVVLTAAMSLYETAHSGQYAYFDSAVTLLFFLLIGRYLDRRARGRARSAAEQLLGLGAVAVTVLDAAGERHLLPPSKVVKGARVFVTAGERIGVDGAVLEGRSDVDTAMITGEAVPEAVRPGTPVFAGTLNLSAPLTVEVTAVGDDTLLADIVRLMETAEQGRARFVAIADRVARYYAPVVHTLALLTFLGWWLLAGLVWQEALMIAVAVLIVTCPCALGLAVPVVQVIASGSLMRAGILVKSGTALERLTAIDRVVFDKTGTLTRGRPELSGTVDGEALKAAAALAGASHHPLAQAVVRAAPKGAIASGVREEAGRGLALPTPQGEVRLGSREWCGIAGEQAEVSENEEHAGPELWLSRPGEPPVPFRFEDQLRSDAGQVVRALQDRGLPVELLSGDRPAAVAAVAKELGINDFAAGCAPADKVTRLGELTTAGQQVLMVGDGLNDAPALSTASVSLSPASAADISQTAADVVFQGDRLSPVLETIEMAERADALVKQNIALSFLYNGITVPLAVAGLVTPLIAAVAMSASSIVVILNALRLSRR